MTTREEIQRVEQEFAKRQEEGAVHEREIVKHQNALQGIREEILRLQGEWRALDKIIKLENASCTQSNKETASPK